MDKKIYIRRRKLLLSAWERESHLSFTARLSDVQARKSTSGITAESKSMLGSEIKFSFVLNLTIHSVMK